MQDTATSPTKLGLAASTAHLRAASSTFDADAAVGAFLGVQFLPKVGHGAVGKRGGRDRTLDVGMGLIITVAANGGMTVRTVEDGDVAREVFANVGQEGPTAFLGTPDGVRVVAVVELGAEVNAFLEGVISTNAANLIVRDQVRTGQTCDVMCGAKLHAHVEPRLEAVGACARVAPAADAQVMLHVEAHLAAMHHVQREAGG